LIYFPQLIAPDDPRCRCSSKQALAALSDDEAIEWLQAIAAVESRVRIIHRRAASPRSRRKAILK
jgi:hypothetical protein